MQSIAISRHIPNLSSALENSSQNLERALTVTDSGVLRAARTEWANYRQVNGFKYSAPKLLSYPDNQLKLEKSKQFTVGLTLQHANKAGVESCPWRGECASICVLDNGNGRYANTQKARDIKTRFLYNHPQAFMVLLGHELRELSAKYERVLVRLNMNSDLRFYKILPKLVNGELFPNLYFYDYTKNPAILSGNGMIAGHYRLVFSVNESSNLVKVRNFVSRGGTAAIVTSRTKKDKPPSLFMGLPVIDGDATDNRYDESGSWVDLYAKGKARALIGKSEFVKTISEGVKIC
jgi:hypothetical protein